MSRIYFGLLMIFFISGQTIADEEFKSSSKLVETIIGWGTKIYESIESYKNPDQARRNLETVMRQVEEASSKLNALENHFEIKLETMLDTLFADIQFGSSLHQLTQRLRHCFIKLDQYFDRSLQYKLGQSFGNGTLQSFAHKALWNNDSVPKLLSDMHAAFFPNDTANLGFLSAIHFNSMLHIHQQCDDNVSMQQKIYYIYVHLIITEIKGLLTRQHCLNIKHLFDSIPLTYKAELDLAKNEFETRLKQYHELFTKLITLNPQHIRRCVTKSPQRGVHFLELEKFSRLTFLDPQIVPYNECDTCPSNSKLHDISLSTNTTIYNCKPMGTRVTACLEERDSHREYLGWKNEMGQQYGLNTSCATPKYIDGRYTMTYNETGHDYYRYDCQVCACSTDINRTQKDDDNSTIWRISVTQQISDIMNNKIVTGVRFVIHDNALHLQIQETQFFHGGMVHNNSEWKELDVGINRRGAREVQELQYENLRHDRKSLYIDDIKVPEGYVVTGVRFQLVDDSAFKLQILATQFHFETGMLFPYINVWLDASTDPMNREDYQRERVEIHMDTPDCPTTFMEFGYNTRSNKLIKFTHSDMYKDGGQTTIPLLDAQSVEAQPPFPLGGVGLAFRKREPSGGYIAPHIYTLDVTKHMTFLDINTDHSQESTDSLQSTGGYQERGRTLSNFVYFRLQDVQPHVIQI